ncbi:phage head closure protein [Lonepinella sp. BR2930]|uniref:phage head closure protein n=1 Tax=Lonepinella sp. BR2930 TaxID=3434554 RepID=UPI003F6DA819
MARMIKAGKYNKVITLQNRNYAKEKESGHSSGYNPIWEDFATVRASVEPIQGREYFSGPFQMGENIIRVRIRYIDNVDRKMRIKYGDRLLSIYSVIDSKDEHRELQLMCKEGEAYGNH